MAKGLQITGLTNWVKLFTYISATVLLIIDNNFNQLKYLIPLVLLLFIVNYSRDYILERGSTPKPYVWISLALEMLLIIGIGLFDRTNVSILFFFVCISSTIIIHPFIYSLPLVGVYLFSEFFMYARENGFSDLTHSLVSLLFSYGVSTVFVMGMSYLVKMQIREKEKLARTHNELEEAYKKLIEHSAVAQKLSVEQERTRMAREIHDTLAHTLTTLIVQLEACKKLASVDPTRLPIELEKAQELSRSGFNDVKRSIKALRPQVMEDQSLIASLHSIINTTRENTQVAIQLQNHLPQDIKLASPIEVAMVRIIQESITNSIRHGQAKEINITIEEENNTLRLSIIDHGVGCASLKKGYGTLGIQERIESLKGSVQFLTSPGQGFRTEVFIPYEGA